MTRAREAKWTLEGMIMRIGSVRNQEKNNAIEAHYSNHYSRLHEP